MMRLVLIGNPVEHSLSPAMHNAALECLGMDKKFRFESCRVTAAGLEAFMASVRAGGIAGLSVTMPHKTSAIAHLDNLSEDAKRAGAANTIIVRGTVLEGHNTDGIGCLRALEDAGAKIRGSDVMLLGAGGAARAAAFALASCGPKSLTILNRTLDKAVELAGSVGEFYSIEAKGCNSDFIGNTKPDIFVNATPGKQVLPDGFLRRGMTVLDMAYGPSETELIRQAREAGARAIPGTEMLLHQGAEQFRLFTGRDAPLDVMRRAVGGIP